MDDPLKIAVVGSGFGVKVALPAYQKLDEFEPVAVWSRRRERAEEVAKEAGVGLGTSDYEELLSVPGLEAVHIATPVVTHLEFARAAAQRGLHVLCEKPLADNLADAWEIAEAIRSAGVVGAVGYELRLKETRQHLIDRAREALGRPRMVSVSLVQSDHADPDSRPRTWVHDAAMGGGRLQGYGVHDLDMLLQCLPPIEAVAAATEVGVPRRTSGDDRELLPVSAEDAYAILLQFRGGGLGVVSLVSTARHDRADLVELYGEEGTVKLDAEQRLWWARAGDELRCEGPFDNSSSTAFERLARQFWAAVRRGEPAEPSLDEGLRVQAVYDAVRIAAAERRWVHPEPVTPAEERPKR